MASTSSLPSPTLGKSPEGLCSRCVAFDLDDALQFDPATAIRTVMEITQLEPKTCAFCRFLSGSMGQLPKDGMHNLVAIQPHFLMTTLLEYIEAPVLCIEPQRQFSTVYDVYSSIIYGPSRSNVSNLVPITPLIDYKVIREWIDLCVRNHRCDGIRREKTSTYDTNVRDLKVIDCKNRLVGDLPTTASYVTLSYVWGKPDVHVPDQQSHLESPDSYFLSPSLPRTIEDAINFTLALGYEYLWVDRYCLNKCSKLELGCGFPS